MSQANPFIEATNLSVLVPPVVTLRHLERNQAKRHERILTQTRNYLLRSKVVAVDRVAPIANEIVNSVFDDKIEQRELIRMAIARAADTATSIRESDESEIRMAVVPPPRVRPMRPASPITPIAVLRFRWWCELSRNMISPIRRLATATDVTQG